MKKIFANIVLVMYIMFFFAVSGMASELYYIKNANKDTVLSVAQNEFKTSGYTIKSVDPVYGVNGIDNAIIVVQPTGADLYYYYDSTSDKKLNKTILSTVKSKGMNYKKMRNDTVSMSMAQTAIALKKSLSTEKKVYNFDEVPTQQNGGNPATVYKFDDVNTYSGYVAQIPVGTNIDVYLQSTVNTASAERGDEVVAVLTKNWEYNGYVIAEQGSTVTGMVTKANSAGLAYRDGVVKFTFTQLRTTTGKVYQISTEDIEFKVSSSGKASNAAGKVVGRALLGALAGLVVGAISDDTNIGKATAIGAGAGAAWGAGSAVMERGTDAEIPVYTEMVLTLTAPLNVVISD